MAKIGLKQLDSILSGSLQVSGSSGVTGSLSLTGTTSTPNAKILVNSSNSKLNIGGTIVVSDNNNRIGLGDTAPSAPDTELHIKSDTPVVTLQRTANTQKSSIDFQGQGGTVGSSIEYVANTNDLSFQTFDGSNPHEKLRLEDGAEGNIKVSGSTQITGSLNVSSSIISSQVTASNLNVSSDASVGGDLFVTEYIKHKGDVNTNIRFTDNRIRFDAGGMTFLGMHDDDSAPFTVTVNPSSNKINFKAMDENNDLLLKTNSETFKVELYHAGSEKLTTEAGGINVTGHVTASGNISGSGTGSFGRVVAQNGRFSDLQVTDDMSITDDLGVGGVLTATGGTILGNAVTDTHSIVGHVTASGNISSSAASTASFGTYIGDGSQLTGITSVTTSSIENLNAGIISGSSQLPSGIISGSGQLPSGIISGSTHIFTAVTSSGDISGSGTGSFGVINVGGGVFTSASLAAGGAGGSSYNGNRRILQTGFPTLFSASFNPGTDGTITEFLDAVFYPNTAPSVSGSAFDVNEFEVSSSVIGTITATDAEALSSEISFSTQSGYSDDFFKIHSGSGEIRLNTMSTASMNTVARPQDSLSSHPFLVQVSDTITTSNATIHIRVIPNTAPKFRTSGIGGSVITSNTGSVNENTTNGTTVLTMFVTDDESDTITLTPLSQSANNHFSSSFTDVVGGKQLLIKTATGSFDFESITSYNLAISASDQHFGSTPSSSGFITTMPILVNVSDNQAPTMASQVFAVNESSGSFPDIGLGGSTNSLTTVGTITTNDNEGDTVTFTSLSLTSGSGGSNTGQSDPSNNPFQVTSAGVIQLKAAQFLNSDIFNQYKYNATYKDNFNVASSSGVITINIEDDLPPSITTNVSGNSFHIIESALSGSSIRQGTNGRTGTVADINSNESVLFVITPSGSLPSNTKDTGSLGISSTGNLSVGFDVSGSNYNFDTGNVLSGSVTITNNFGTTNTTNINVSMSINNGPTASFSNTSANLNTNGARPGNNLTTISFSDTESDSLNHDTFVFTDPSGQLSATKSGDTYLVRATSNLSGSTVYNMTASINDVHGFRTQTSGHTISITQAPTGTLTTNGTFRIIESATNGALIRTNSNGLTGTQADVGVTYSPQLNSAAVASFTSSNSDINVSSTGALSLGFNLSGSVSKSGDTLGTTITFRDQFDNVGSGAVTINVVTNNAPSISFSPSSVTLPAERAISGSFVTSASFSDTESDSINFDTFSLTGTHGSLFDFERVGNAMIITAKTDLSASSYSFSSHVRDQHGFNAATSSLSITVKPMIYAYKNTNTLVLDGTESEAIKQLGDNGGDDVGITSGSFMGQLKAGKIGDSTITEAGGQQMILVASQSVNHLANDGGTSTFRQFGNINLSGNSDNGHQFIVLYPSSSQVFQKPNSLRAGLGGSTDREFTLFNDNSSSDQAITAGLHYFGTDSGVKVFGNDRWGMIFSLDASTNPTQFYHLLSSSGSAPSSEV